MIDLFALGLTHALLALAAWRLTARADLDGPGALRVGSKRHRRPAAETDADDD